MSRSLRYRWGRPNSVCILSSNVTKASTATLRTRCGNGWHRLSMNRGFGVPASAGLGLIGVLAVDISVAFPLCISRNPKGIPSCSPGLRGHALPWGLAPQKPNNPEGVASESRPKVATSSGFVDAFSCTTPLGSLRGSRSQCMREGEKGLCMSGIIQRGGIDSFPIEHSAVPALCRLACASNHAVL